MLVAVTVLVASLATQALYALPASATLRTYRSIQYNLQGGVGGGTPQRSSVQLLEAYLHLYANDPLWSSLWKRYASGRVST